MQLFRKKPAAPPTISTRWLLQRDIAEVLEIEQLGFEFPWTEDQLRQCLREKCNIGIVGECQGKVVGFVIYQIAERRMDVLNLAVHPSCWRRGVGRNLIDRLKSRLAPDNHRAITAEVRETNVKAQLFFRSQGFKCVGMVQDHYDDVVEDAYRFRFEDADGECAGI